MVRCWEPNGSCIHEKGPDKGYIGDKYGFLLLTLVGTSKGLKDVEDKFGMSIEF